MNCNGQKQSNKLLKSNNKMDVIYTKNFDKFTLTLTRNIFENQVEWKTIVRNKKGIEIVLDLKSIEKDLAWKFQEKRNETPIDLSNISNSYLDDNNLYIIYNHFGKITLEKFTFLLDDKIKKEETIIDNYLVSGGFGGMVNYSEVKKIDLDLYFFLTNGQTGTGVKNNFFKVSLIDFKVKKIDFQSYTKKVVVFNITEYGKEKYLQEKKRIGDVGKNTTTNSTEIQVFSKVGDYIKKGTNFINESNISELEKLDDITDIERKPLFIKSYGDVGYNDEKKLIDENKISNAQNYLEEALMTLNKNNHSSNVKFLGYIYDSGQKNLLYLFYKENGKTKICLFDNYKNEWQIGDYKEDDIK